MNKNLSFASKWWLPGLVILCLAGLPFCASKPTSSTTSKETKPAAKPTVPANPAPGLEDQVVELVNKYRKTKGLPALQVNFAIAAEARKHTMAMATQRTEFGHGGFTIRNKIITAKVPGVTTVAENVAFGSNSAKEALDGWLKSPGHLKNIEGNYKLTGVGVARDQNARLYFTQIFAR